MGDTTVSALPIHPTLFHPRTGDPLRAVGVVNGRVIWPVLGGAEAAADAPSAAPQGDPAGQQTPPNPAPPNGATPQGTPPPSGDKADEPLGPNGVKALQAERKRADEFERQLKELEPLKRIAAALTNGDDGNGKTEVEQLAEKFAKYEADLAKERNARMRVEVAHKHDLPADLADRLRGDTLEELEADALKLKQLIPATAAGRPKPDRSQGGGASSEPAGGSVQSGRDLFRNRNQKKQ